jgi:hypothetical protein
MAGYQVSKESQKMIIYGILIIIVAVVIIWGGAAYFIQDYDTHELENSLVVSRLLLSEDCLASEEFGKLNLDHFNLDTIKKCTGVNDDSKLGLHIKLFDLNKNLIEEIEINKPLTSQCMLSNIKNIREKYFCSFSKHYVLFEDNKGVLEIEVVNDIKE